MQYGNVSYKISSEIEVGVSLKIENDILDFQGD